MRQRIFNALLWVLVGLLVALAFSGCARRVVTKTQTLVISLPSELFVCKTHFAGRVLSHAEVLERYASAVAAYSSCKRAVEVLKKTNEELKNGKH